MAGEDGTLAKRTFPGARGGLRAKTGSLNGVHALAGFLSPEQGEEIVFAILASDGGRCGYSAGAEILDRAAAVIAALPQPRRGE